MKQFFTFFMLLTGTGAFCQTGGVGINPNGSPPDPSAILDLSATNKGFIMPRISQAQRDSINAPAFGLMIINTTTNCINIWLGSTWKKICGDCDFDNPVAGNNGPLCAGDTLRLSASNVPGVSYHWSGPDGFSSALQNPVVADITSAASGTYSVVATLNGCSSPPQNTEVTVNSATTPVTTNNGPLCAGNSLFLNSSTVAGATYSWTGPNGFTSNNQNPTLSVSGSSGGTYNVVAEVNGCFSDTGSTTLVVYSNSPGQPGTITGSTTNLGGAANISYSIASVPYATSYAWTVPSGATITSGQGDTSITVTFGCNAGGNIVVSANNTCGLSQQTTLNVSTSFVTPGAITGDTAVNNGDSATYSITPVANATGYTWTTSLGTITAGQGTSSITVHWDTSGIGSLSVVENTSCGSSPAQSLTVYISTAAFYATGSLNSGTIQAFTVPAGVTSITIDAYGAQGGTAYSGSYNFIGGLGAHIKGTFNVTAGQLIEVVTGQLGGSSDNYNSGGGGGSFIWDNATSNLMIAAGGGGGGGNLPNGEEQGSANNNGNNGQQVNGAYNGGGTGYGTGGTNGGGGNGGAGGSGPGTNGGGAGWISSGTGQGAGSTKFSFAGGTGGTANGGFGGGGGQGNCCGGGGGGGYSGGGGSGWASSNPNCNAPGGGGGSYNGGTSQTNTGGVQSGNGVVLISW